MDSRDASYLNAHIHKLEGEYKALRRAVDSNLTALQELKQELLQIEKRLDKAQISTDSILLSVLFFFGFLIVVLQEVKHADPELGALVNMLCIGGFIAMSVLVIRCVMSHLRR